MAWTRGNLDGEKVKGAKSVEKEDNKCSHLLDKELDIV